MNLLSSPEKCFPTRVLIFDQKWEINLIKGQVSHDMYQRKNLKNENNNTRKLFTLT